MRTAKALCIAALALCLSAVFAAGAGAAQTIDSFEVGTSDSGAGRHPDLTTSFTLESPGEAPRNVAFNAPEGVFGNPNAATRCTAEAFAAQTCQPDTQVGLVSVRANYEGDPNYLLGTAPLFDLLPGVGQTALFGFIAPTANVPVQIPVSVRSADDYGLRFQVSEITQQIPLASAKLLFWGFPGNEANDAERFAQGFPGDPAGCPGVDIDLSDVEGIDLSGCIAEPLPAGYEPKPLINNPTVCTGEPLTATLDVETYQDPGASAHAEADYPATDECEKQVFRPVLTANTTTDQTDSPSGLDLVFSNPQFLSTAAAPSQLRRVIARLPDGLTVNPDAADGQSACADADANFDSEGPANCPDKAKIGTFKLHTVALDSALEGSIYIGEPKPGQQYRLFLIASGLGINAKFIAPVDPDPKTGRLTVEIPELPQIAFDTVEFHLFASDRGLMATPTRCSVYPVSAQFFPWNDQLADQTSTQFFSLETGPGGGPCPGVNRPFNPHLEAGTTNPLAGAFSDFYLKLDRDDGDQFIRDLGFTMPEGFTGSLVGLDYCPEASISSAASKSGTTEKASPSCPSSAFIGTSDVAAGPGSHPFHAQGKIYMAGPFKGAPLSIVVVTPALAGPYDYGTIVVRVAVHVDPLTAQVSALSDTVPQIIGGIPLRIRSIRVNLDRDNFTLNPTSCAAKSVESQGVGDEGAVANFSSYFNAVNCATLPFQPRMRVRQLGGSRKTKRSQNPPLLFDLWTGAGHANIRRLAVILPNVFQVDQRHLGNICSERELAANDCAGRQSIGRAFTKTPLLDKRLAGDVYAVSGTGGLPRLAFILDGQVRVLPRADTTTIKGARLKTVVPVIPDAPVGHFRFFLKGGRQGYLVNNRSLCTRPPLAIVRYLGQNGKPYTQRLHIQAACGKRGARRGKRSGRRAARRASVSGAVAVR